MTRQSGCLIGCKHTHWGKIMSLIMPIMWFYVLVYPLLLKWMPHESPASIIRTCSTHSHCLEHACIPHSCCHKNSGPIKTCTDMITGLYLHIWLLFHAEIWNIFQNAFAFAVISHIWFWWSDLCSTLPLPRSTLDLSIWSITQTCPVYYTPIDSFITLFSLVKISLLNGF